MSQPILDCRNKAGAEAVASATFQIEPLADTIARLANDLDIDSDTAEPCAVLIALALRIKKLNSVIMSAASGDDITLAAGYRAITGLTDADPLIQAQGNPAGVSPESDYMEGVRLAVDIFTAGKALPGSEQDACELRSKFRGKGIQQNNFAIGYVLELIEKPQLVEGFAAVLSNISAVQGQVEPEELSALTYAQIKGTAAPARRTTRNAEAVPA